MKTAIQKVAQELVDIEGLNSVQLKEIIRILTQGLKQEKEQIIKANRDGVDMCIEHSKFLTGKEYFEKTFKN